MMGADTFRYPVQGFAFSDVYAMPKKGYLIDYGNGSFHISKSGGHVHWYWIKSGWIFRVGSAGYTALYLANELRNDKFSIKGANLGIPAGIFLSGILLKHIYKPVLRVRNKYHLEMVNLSATVGGRHFGASASS